MTSIIRPWRFSLSCMPVATKEAVLIWIMMYHIFQAFQFQTVQSSTLPVKSTTDNYTSTTGLPSVSSCPQNVRVANKTTTWMLIHWDRPEICITERCSCSISAVTNATNSVISGECDVNSNSGNLGQLMPGEKYVVTVDIFVGSGLPKCSNKSSAERTLPTEPTNVRLTNRTRTTALLQASIVGTADRCTAIINATNSQPSCTISNQTINVDIDNLTPGDLYRVTVTVLSGDLNSSIDEYFWTRPALPTNLTAVRTSSTFDLIWSYEGTIFSCFATANASDSYPSCHFDSIKNSVNVGFANLTPGELYRVNLTVYNGGQDGEYLLEDLWTRPSQPTNVTAKRSRSTIALKLSYEGSITHCNATVNASNSHPSCAIDDKGNVIEVIIGNLTSGNLYRVMVTVYSGDQHSSIYEDFWTSADVETSYPNLTAAVITLAVVAGVLLVVNIVTVSIICYLKRRQPGTEDNRHYENSTVCFETNTRGRRSNGSREASRNAGPTQRMGLPAARYVEEFDMAKMNERGSSARGCSGQHGRADTSTRGESPYRTANTNRRGEYGTARM